MFSFRDGAQCKPSAHETRWHIVTKGKKHTGHKVEDPRIRGQKYLVYCLNVNFDWDAEAGRPDSLGVFCVSVGSVANREPEVLTPLKGV